jgi:hypothetical protein
VWRRLARSDYFAWPRLNSERIGYSLGVLSGVAIAFALVPTSLKDDAVHHFTGTKPSDSAPLPASDVERQRLAERVRPAALAGDPAAQVELGLALQYGAAGEPRDMRKAGEWIRRAAGHAQGYEGKLVLAASRLAEPVPSPGRMLTDADAASQVAALRRIAPELPSDWHPVLVGTIADVLPQHYGGTHPDDQDTRDALSEAGRVGGRAYAVKAAGLDEAIATGHERAAARAQARGARAARKASATGTEDSDAETVAAASAVAIESGRAAAAWRRAQQGYASAGAIYEVERLRIETDPDRLEAFPDPPPVRAWPPPDAGLAERLKRFAWALEADYTTQRTPHELRSLARAAALAAVEREPDPGSLAGFYPARDWMNGEGAVGRFLLALRHARGDCAAALELSNKTRFRRQTGFSNITPKVSMHDMSWALAWAESAERCAVAEELRTEAGQRRLALQGMYIDKQDMASARAGVVATIAALRQ